MTERPPAQTLLPLALCETPPGLLVALGQEGIAVRDWTQHDDAPIVLFDSKNACSRQARRAAKPGAHWIDVDALRTSIDPMRCLLDTRSCWKCWNVEAGFVRERVARIEKSTMRRAIVEFVRGEVLVSGGLWLRLSPIPWPYQGVFNFRVDLDEHAIEDYRAFAQARTPLEDATTHFVSTAAYGTCASVMDDLARFDTQSHGHYHHVARDAEFNLRNLTRAHEALARSGIRAEGFAAPGGRWNPGLDSALETLGYQYSSDFQLHCDDWPAFPWLGERFSRVLQLPIHPVCEGIFLEAGLNDHDQIARYYTEALRSKIAAGQPAFLYGHPERRLARMPQVFTALAAELRRHSAIWRTTLTQFSRWWHKRNAQRWSASWLNPGVIVVDFEGDPTSLGLALEIDNGTHTARFPVSGRRVTLEVRQLTMKKKLRFDAPTGFASGPHGSWNQWIKDALDWEKTIPPQELPTRTITARLKKRLRIWQERKS